jgi:AraC family transcriptional regulator
LHARGRKIRNRDQTPLRASSRDALSLERMVHAGDRQGALGHESHIREAFWLVDVARVSGLSRFHTARNFSSIVGPPVLDFARARVLGEAARLPADDAPDILQVALAVGYGWHEAFTRAFRDQFGLTPEDVRARRSLANLPITEPIRMPDQPAKTMMPDRFVAGATMLF